MGIIGGIIVGIILSIIALTVTAVLISFFWSSRIGCIIISAYSAYYTQTVFVCGNFEGAGDFLWTLAKTSFLLMLSLLFLLGPRVVDMDNDGIYEWQDSLGDWHASLGDDWFTVYLKYIFGSFFSFAAICFFADDLSFSKYIFWIPVLFGAISLISVIRRIISD